MSVAIQQSTSSINESVLLQQANCFDLSTLRQVLDHLSEHYHNDVSLVSDNTFDQLVGIYESKFGKYEQTGMLPRGEKVSLPYYLTGLDKIKTEKELNLWMSKCSGPYVLEDKIDGLTLLYTISNGVKKLYTRGRNGIGKDVSHVIPDLKLPTINTDLAVRGEIVMIDDTFKQVGQGFSNARNLVSGIFNSKDNYKPELARELTFIGYQIMDSIETPEQQILQLRNMGFNIPWAATSLDLNVNQLEQIYLTRKTQAPYKMDGLVIYQNHPNVYPTEGLPKHIIAFKTMSETAETVVTQVIWKASKNRLLKPVIHYQPVVLSGATLERTNGDNARYIVLNKIGPGAKIIITRSGDVIPRIVSVVQPANQIAFPDPQEHGEYTWNESQVEFILKADNSQVLAAKIEHFLTKLEIRNVGPLRVKAFVDSGLTSIYHVLTATPERLTQIDRIGPILANQIYQDIHNKINGVSLARIMAACGVFPNIAEKRFNTIIQVYPNLLSMVNDPVNVLTERIQQIKGFNELAAEIAIKLPIFANWLSQHPMIRIEELTQPTINSNETLLTIVSTAQVITQTLTGMVIVFSGFRDKELEGAIEMRGGRVRSSISKNTTMLVMKDINDRKGKANEAINKGIPLVAKEEFINHYIK